MKRPDEEKLFNFVKELLSSNGIAQSIFWKRLRTLEIEGKIVNKPSEKGNFSLPKSNLYVCVNSSDISSCQFPSSKLSFPQDLRHDLSITSREIETVSKTSNQSLQCITRVPPRECVSTETQAGDVSSAEYVDYAVGTNDDLFFTVTNKGMETDSV